jgi:hypothetical protein
MHFGSMCHCTFCVSRMNGVDNNNPQVGMGMSAPPFRHAGPPQPPMGGQVRPLGPPIPGQMPGGQQMRPMGPPMPGQMPGGQQMPPMQGGQMPPMPGGQMPARPPGMPGAPPGGFPSHSQPVARPNTQTIYPDQKPSQNQVVQEANGGHFDTNGAPSPHITTDFGNAGPRYLFNLCNSLEVISFHELYFIVRQHDLNFT